jgi:hypothetical protein
VDAVRGHIAHGASLDAEDPTDVQSPLARAVIGDQTVVIDYLLDAGAHPRFVAATAPQTST